jgi:ribosomal-protein-alanine N-acetyltransferase
MPAGTGQMLAAIVWSNEQVICIRRARSSDIPAILRIEKKSFGGDAWDREAFVDYLAQPDRSVFLVATIKGKIVGYALAFHAKTRAEVDSIAVAPAQRGQGVAVALMKRIVFRLARRGFKAVSLSVRLENEAAIRLYRKLGFRRIRRINSYYEDGAPAWRMRK